MIKNEQATSSFVLLCHYQAGDVVGNCIVAVIGVAGCVAGVLGILSGKGLEQAVAAPLSS